MKTSCGIFFRYVQHDEEVNVIEGEEEFIEPIWMRLALISALTLFCFFLFIRRQDFSFILPSLCSQKSTASSRFATYLLQFFRHDVFMPHDKNYLSRGEG